MSVDNVKRLHEIRRQQSVLRGELALLADEARTIGELICCATCKVEAFFPAPGGAENLPEGWVLAACDNDVCLKCWAYWCAEHRGDHNHFECAACTC